MSYSELINEEEISFGFFKNQEDETSSLQVDYFLSSFVPFDSSFEIYHEVPLNEEDWEIPHELNENEYYNNQRKLSFFKPLFEHKNQKKVSLFSRLDNPIEEETFCQRKRYPNKRRRKEYNDNMRKKIKRGFFNNEKSVQKSKENSTKFQFREHIFIQKGVE